MMEIRVERYGLQGVRVTVGEHVIRVPSRADALSILMVLDAPQSVFDALNAQYKNKAPFSLEKDIYAIQS